MIDTQDQQKKTLSLSHRQRQRYDGVLRALAGVEIAWEHEQIASETSSANENTAFDASTDGSQEQVTDLDNFLDAISHFSEDISEAVPFYTPRASLLGSSLELSGTVYPEQYVTEGPLHERLVVFSMVELYRTSTARVDKYFLLFAKDARHWRRVTVTATAKIGSRLSEVSSAFIPLSYHTPPGLVQPQLEAVLETTQLEDLVNSICIELQSDNGSEITFDPSFWRISGDLQQASLADSSQYVEEIEHRGLPQYLESEVIVLSRINTQLFLVLVESQQLMERKPPFTKNGMSDIADFFADMKLLQMAQGCPGVAKFVGVVLSDDRTELCSYLLQFPEQGSVQFLLNAARLDGTLIPWKRRERWIRQIITTVVEIHKRGIFVGHVEISTMWVDSNDDIIFISFKSVADHIRNRHGHAPPELRKLTAPGAIATGQSLTFQSDLFQLGLCIWMLTEHVATVTGIFCSKSGCETFPHFRCTADHVNPIKLPLCGSEVPEFIDVIVGHCRQERPCQRKPASALLALLPTDHDSEGFCPKRISFLTHSFRAITCTECAKVTTDEHYHCNVCHHGDFDLCPQCFSAGIPCYDNGHKLSRRVHKNCRLINETTSVS